MTRRWIGFGAAMLLVTGCYTLQPVTGTTPQLGTEVALDLNDAGRLALGPSMGPEIGQVGGRLVSRDATEYLVAVTGLKLLRGGEQVWHGEQVHIKSEYVSSVYERRFSKGRTLVLGGIVVGGVAAIVLTRSLFGSGEEAVTTPPDTMSTRIIRP